ncbi:hypothetical protein CLOM_g11936 [Closterium sp. NIES-68]|nr:hypothetical protein CLOM_g11936 [Closterium sp. NIES-68]
MMKGERAGDMSISPSTKRFDGRWSCDSYWKTRLLGDFFFHGFLDDFGFISCKSTDFSPKWSWSSLEGCTGVIEGSPSIGAFIGGIKLQVSSAGPRPRTRSESPEVPCAVN